MFTLTRALTDTKTQPNQADASRPGGLRRPRKPAPLLPVRLPNPEGYNPVTPRTPSFFDSVISIISQAGFSLRPSPRRLNSSSSTSPCSASTPPSPALEQSIALALLAQSRNDSGQQSCQIFQAARKQSGTTTEHYTTLLNDLWVNPATGLKANCLTHALMSGNDSVAELLEAHGAEESFCSIATPEEMALLKF